MQEIWNSEEFLCKSTGTAEHWKSETVECWNIGMLEQWNDYSISKEKTVSSSKEIWT